jgi:hypothetical protein
MTNLDSVDGLASLGDLANVGATRPSGSDGHCGRSC